MYSLGELKFHPNIPCSPGRLYYYFLSLGAHFPLHSWSLKLTLRKNESKLIFYHFLFLLKALRGRQREQFTSDIPRSMSFLGLWDTVTNATSATKSHKQVLIIYEEIKIFQHTWGKHPCLHRLGNGSSGFYLTLIWTINLPFKLSNMNICIWKLPLKLPKIIPIFLR